MVLACLLAILACFARSLAVRCAAALFSSSLTPKFPSVLHPPTLRTPRQVHPLLPLYRLPGRRVEPLAEAGVVSRLPRAD